jgi:sugar lactone lactonase YvrE
MRTGLIVLLLLALAGGVLYRMAPIDPASWQPPPNPGLVGEFAPNRALASVERLVEGVGRGPEAVACAPDGTFYTGFENGLIVRFGRDGRQPTKVVNTGGRPLGIKVDADGSLVVADAVRGLVRVTAAGEVVVLADEHDGKRMRFVDDLAIGADGRIWFSDASQRNGFETTLRDFMEGIPTGRLLSYDPETGALEVHIEQLFFANGVALGPDDTYVLVNETGTGQIHRLWLKGDRQGQRDLFHAGLPGTPDNITFNGRDTFWVAMPSLRERLDVLSGLPILRRYMSLLPDAVLHANTDSYAFVVGLDLRGRVVANLQDADRGFVDTTSAVECDGALYMGSLTMPSLAVHNLR